MGDVLVSITPRLLPPTLGLRFVFKSAVLARFFHVRELGGLQVRARRFAFGRDDLLMMTRKIQRSQ